MGSQCRSVSEPLLTAFSFVFWQVSSLVVGGKFGPLGPNDRRVEIPGSPPCRAYGSFVTDTGGVDLPDRIGIGVLTRLIHRDLVDEVLAETAPSSAVGCCRRGWSSTT